MLGPKGIKRIESDEPSQSVDAPAEEFGFTLDQLGSAYEQALQEAAGADFKADSGPVNDATASDEMAVEDAPVEELLTAPKPLESDMAPVTPESILEAILFVGTNSNAPLSAERFVEIVRGVSVSDVPKMVQELNRSYRNHSRAMEIVENAEGYRMQLAPDLEHVRERFYGKVKELTLNQSAVDCLSLVAYQPGVTREQIEKQWNQPAANMLNMLVRKGLIRVDMVADEPDENETRKSIRKTPHYYTTERFLEVIGLQSIHDLPQAEDL